MDLVDRRRRDVSEHVCGVSDVLPQWVVKRATETCDVMASLILRVLSTKNVAKLLDS